MRPDGLGPTPVQRVPEGTIPSAIPPLEVVDTGLGGSVFRALVLGQYSGGGLPGFVNPAWRPPEPLLARVGPDQVSTLHCPLLRAGAVPQM